MQQRKCSAVAAGRFWGGKHGRFPLRNVWEMQSDLWDCSEVSVTSAAGALQTHDDEAQSMHCTPFLEYCDLNPRTGALSL